jgi:hypothetical protein
MEKIVFSYFIRDYPLAKERQPSLLLEEYTVAARGTVIPPPGPTSVRSGATRVAEKTPSRRRPPQPLLRTLLLPEMAPGQARELADDGGGGNFAAAAFSERRPWLGGEQW